MGKLEEVIKRNRAQNTETQTLIKHINISLNTDREYANIWKKNRLIHLLVQ